MKINETELLAVKRSALVSMPGRPEIRLVKGAVIRANDPIVRGREDHFEPVHSEDVMARTSFVTGSMLVVKGSRFAADSPIVKGREQMFVPVASKVTELPAPGSRSRTPRRRSK